MNIASAGNAETACLRAILDRGYKVSITVACGEASYYAKKNGNSYSAHTGIELLGLVALGEQYGEEWQDKALAKDPLEEIEIT